MWPPESDNVTTLAPSAFSFSVANCADVAAPGDETGLPLEGFPAGFEHVRREVHRTVTRRLGPDERAAPVDPFAGENTGELVGDALVLTE